MIAPSSFACAMQSAQVEKAPLGISYSSGYAAPAASTPPAQATPADHDESTSSGTDAVSSPENGRPTAEQGPAPQHAAAAPVKPQSDAASTDPDASKQSASTQEAGAAAAGSHHAKSPVGKKSGAGATESNTKSAKKDLHAHASVATAANGQTSAVDATTQDAQPAAAAIATEAAAQGSGTATLPEVPPATSAVTAGSSAGSATLTANAAPAANVQPAALADSGKALQVQPAGQETAASAGANPDESQASSSEDHHASAAAQGFVFQAAEAGVAALQTVAVFAPSLLSQPLASHDHVVSATLSSAPAAVATGGAAGGAAGIVGAQPAPVRALEVAVNDPLLGSMDVRAELRGGALHASVTGTGTQDTAASAMPALHQFLQQHEINVQSLTYASGGDTTTRATATASTGGDMTRDTAGGGFAGGAGSQQQGGNAAQDQRRPAARSTYSEETFAAAGYTASTQRLPSAIHSTGVLSTGSTLSIHI